MWRGIPWIFSSHFYPLLFFKIDREAKFVAQFLKQIREKSAGPYPLDFNYQMTLIKFKKTVSFVRTEKPTIIMNS